MAQPHKGERVAVIVRLPLALAQRLDALKLDNRHAFIIEAIEEKLK